MVLSKQNAILRSVNIPRKFKSVEVCYLNFLEYTKHFFDQFGSCSFVLIASFSVEKHWRDFCVFQLFR